MSSVVTGSRLTQIPPMLCKTYVISGERGGKQSESNRPTISRDDSVVLKTMPATGQNWLPDHHNEIMSDIREVVKQKYGQAALRVATGGSSCCGASAAVGGCDPITRDLYDSSQTAALPEDALKASLGCGNPTALAELNPGETVLDLGSGGGIDVLLSARRVGPAGKAYGLDMTDEMLALANENQRKAGIGN